MKYVLVVMATSVFLVYYLEALLAQRCHFYCLQHSLCHFYYINLCQYLKLESAITSAISASLITDYVRVAAVLVPVNEGTPSHNILYTNRTAVLQQTMPLFYKMNCNKAEDIIHKPDKNIH
jgi:hypothetical protein